MPLFHATDKEFTSGETVQAQGTSSYYSSVAALLDSGRPASAPLRKDLVFAAESLVAATAFCEKQGVPHKLVRVYEVEMHSSHSAPFALIHQIDRRLAGKEDCQALVDEYWSPKREWAFWEVIGPAFVVLNEVRPACESDVLLFMFKYDRDFDQASRL